MIKGILGLLLIAVAAWPSPTSAQSPSGVVLSILEVDDTSFPEVQAIVTVLEPGGLPVQGLAPQDFLAEESGSAAEVLRVDSAVDEQIGIGVILTIDTSGSMLGGPLAQAIDSASAFVQDLTPVDQTAIVTFSSDVEVLTPLSTQHQTAIEGLGGLVAEGNTALYGAVSQSVDLAEQVPLPRKAIILLSDGLDFGSVSDATRDESLAAADTAGVPVYVIGVGEELDREYLQALADQTGGAFLETPTADGIAVLYDQLSQLLRSQYVVTLRSGAAPEIEDRSLALTVETAAGAADDRFDYRTLRTIQPSPTEPPAPTATAPPAPITEEGSSKLPLFIFLGGLALVGAVVAGRFALTGVRNHRATAHIAALQHRADQAPEPPPPTASTATEQQVDLIIEGPDGSRRVIIGSEPRLIGSAAGSDLLLDTADGSVAPQHARVWARDGRLVFHHIAAGHRSMLAGEPVTWVSLDHGDTVLVGPYRLTVEIGGGNAPRAR